MHQAAPASEDGRKVDTLLLFLYLVPGCRLRWRLRGGGALGVYLIHHPSRKYEPEPGANTFAQAYHPASCSIFLSWEERVGVFGLCLSIPSPLNFFLIGSKKNTSREYQNSRICVWGCDAPQ